MKWLVIFIKSDDPHYRLFMSFGGGYMNGDSWRMNSGITRVEFNDDQYPVTMWTFIGASGSSYTVHKDMYGATIFGAGILDNFIKTSAEKNAEITVMPEDTDWSAIDWIIR